MKQSVNVLIIIFLFFISISCNNTTENKKKLHKKEKVTVPDFNSDTAYYYVKNRLILVRAFLILWQI